MRTITLAIIASFLTACPTLDTCTEPATDCCECIEPCSNYTVDECVERFREDLTVRASGWCSYPESCLDACEKAGQECGED